MVFMVFGDGDDSGYLHPTESPLTIEHIYPNQGDYEWTVQVGETDSSILEDTMTGILTLEGPAVILSSSPFPPLFVLGDAGTVDFWTTVEGGTPPYEFSWDLDGNGTFDLGETGETATFDYTEVGKYYPQVMVTDTCTFTSSDTMPVVVADPTDACHPMAQKISDGVNKIFPDYSEDLYTCEDIYAIFDNESEENNLGFGLMWKAYHLAESMEFLTWEDILDWHLDQSGWGALLQLDRFSDLLEDHSIGDLMDLVLSEEFSLADVRTAARSVTRYEADFEDALSRIAEGANAGELGQLYKLAADLEIEDLSIIDGYLADGLTLSELKHTANFADRMEVDWTVIAEFRASADSWGDIKQAYTMSTEGFSAAEILIFGIQEYRKDLQEAAKEGRQVELAVQQEEKNKQTAEKLAGQFSPDAAYVMSLFTEGECEGNWGCVRKVLREEEKAQSEGLSDRGLQTAQQISSKYGVSEALVIEHYNGLCSEDWACTRAYFRNIYMSNKVTGKPEK
jgi:hypothetical protein